MGGITLAWLVGEGIIVYRSVKQGGGPPVPGALLASSGLFVMLGILAQAEQARFLATALAWGFDVAAFMNLVPSVTGAGTTTPFLPTPTGKPAPNLTTPNGG